MGRSSGNAMPAAVTSHIRRFWRRVGFLPVKELSLATWNNEYALVLVRKLA